MKVKTKHLGQLCRCTSCRQPVFVSYEAVSPPVTPFATDGPRHFTEDEVPVHWKKGDRFMGQYEVLEQIGTGGMGVVHLIRHEGWGINLAVKSPKAELLPKEIVKTLFEQECETWVNLDPHPNVVKCYYVRRLGGIPRIFMEHVPGSALQGWLSSGQLYANGVKEALAFILDIAIQMAWGLDYAHRQGLIHQDVKPANVLVTLDGKTKVTDLGLVRALVASADPESGQRYVPYWGTAPFSPPEQGDLDRVDHTCDTWGWAATVFEMLVGKIRWTDCHTLRDTVEAYFSGMDDAPVPEVPETLASLLRQSFEESPEDRPADMGVVADALKTTYEEVTGGPYKRERPEGGKASPATLNNRAVSLADLRKHKDAEELWTKALTLEPNHVESAYNRLLCQWRRGRITDREVILELTGLRDANAGAWFPQYLLSRVMIERGDSRKALELLRDIPEPDASRREVLFAVAVAREREKESRRLARAFQGHADAVTSVFLTWDGWLAVSGSESGLIRLWELTLGECAAQVQAHTGCVYSLCMSTDEKLLMSAGADGKLRLWNVAARTCERTFEGHTQPVRCVRLSENGHVAVSGSQDHTVAVWDLKSGQCLKVLEGHTAGVNSVDLSRCGRYVLSGGRDATLKYWDLKTGQCMRTFTGHEDRIHSVRLSGDKRLAVSGSRDTTVKLWDVSTGRCLRTLQGHHGEAYAVCLSDDQRFVLSGSRNGPLAIWDCATGQCLCSLNGGAPVCLSRYGRFALSGDGKGMLKLWAVGCDKDALLAPFMLCDDRQ